MRLIRHHKKLWHVKYETCAEKFDLLVQAETAEEAMELCRNSNFNYGPSFTLVEKFEMALTVMVLEGANERRIEG